MIPGGNRFVVPQLKSFDHKPLNVNVFSKVVAKLGQRWRVDRLDGPIVREFEQPFD